MNMVKEVVAIFEKIGLTTVIIPFALTFVILFSVLQKTKVLGKEDNGDPKIKINAVVALVFGLLVIAYANTVNVINRIAQYGTVLIIAGFVVLIIFSFSGFHNVGKSKIWKIIGGFIFGMFVLYVLGAFEYLSLDKVEMNIIVPFAAIIAFIVTMYIIIKPSKESETKKEKSKGRETEESETRKTGERRPL